MLFVIILLILFCSIKSFFYAKYELTENKNRFGGIAIIFLTIFSLIIGIFPLFI